MLASTMMDVPLTLGMLLRHGQEVYGDSLVVTCTGVGTTRQATYQQVAERAGQLANALARLGIGSGDRVATFQWNNQEHLEAYLAVPSMGAVLHTLNIRLFPEQLTWVANHAEDRVVIVDASLVPLLAKVLGEMKTVEHVVVVGEADTAPLQGVLATGGDVLSYEELLAAEGPGYDWPEVDERSAAAMCYTSGTTGNPKGVVYSHRSTFLHAIGGNMGNCIGTTFRDRMLPVVPMFHANAWGTPHSAWLAGADQLLPDRFLQAEPLAAFIVKERPTVSAAVPTVWNDLLRYADEHSTDLSSLRLVVCGGSAVPQSLMQAFSDRHGVYIRQAWGMTETSPIGAQAEPPKDCAPDDWRWRTTAGRTAALVQSRIAADDGTVLPRDGEAVGEIEVRGPWVTGSYYLDPDPAKFHDGWLRTGDVGTLDERGFLRITDRSKDVIKSGGEWISSVELENELMGHPDVVEAAVVGVPDERWQERPLAAVVRREGAATTPTELRDYLADRVARWWLPERWAFVPEVPRTSVGKFDKKVIRARHEAGELTVETLDAPAR